MATRATTNIKRRLYQIAIRATAAFSIPADAAAWTTFLGTFTEVGYVRRGSIDGTSHVTWCKSGRADSEVAAGADVKRRCRWRDQ